MAAHVFAQKVAYRPTRHYGERVDMFASLPAVDSTATVMLGNSLTEYGGDWGRMLRADNVVNRGIAGDDAMGIAHRLCQILPGKPRRIFLMVGINDLSHGITAAQTASLVCRLIDRIRRDAPDTELYVQSVLPINESTGRWKRLAGRTDDIPEINRLLNIHCSKLGIVYVDLYPKFVRRGTNVLRRELTSDGLHLSPQGYKLWAFELRKYM
ncbi:sialate-O-acetyltransferase [Prevotella sp. MGM1]|jgi:lysophospholipase L1-like esterase|nr:sialate-O-acetyltransferase [Prevotella sp. MGM1]